MVTHCKRLHEFETPNAPMERVREGINSRGFYGKKFEIWLFFAKGPADCVVQMEYVRNSSFFLKAKGSDASVALCDFFISLILTTSTNFDFTWSSLS